MPASSETLPAREQLLAERPLDLELLGEAWPKGRNRDRARGEIGR